MKPQFVTTVGTYGAGKTTWAKDFFRQHDDGSWVLISPQQIAADTARQAGLPALQALYAPEHIDEYQRYLEAVDTALREAGEAGRNIIYDNTSATPAERNVAMNLVDPTGGRYHKQAVCLLVDKEEAWGRLEARNAENRVEPYAQQISRDLFDAHWEKFQSHGLPGTAEGYQIIHHEFSPYLRKHGWVATASTKDSFKER